MAKYISNPKLGIEAKIRNGRIVGFMNPNTNERDIPVKWMTNSNGKSYAMFTLAIRPDAKENEAEYFTVFCYNMHEAEFVFKTCGYGVGDQLTVEGNLSKIVSFTDENGRNNKAIDMSVTAESITIGPRKRSASEAAMDNQPAAQPQAQPQQQPQQQEIKSFSEVRENLAAEVDEDFPL